MDLNSHSDPAVGTVLSSEERHTWKPKSSKPGSVKRAHSLAICSLAVQGFLSAQRQFRAKGDPSAGAPACDLL